MDNNNSNIIDYIKKNYNLILLAVDADAELRFNRSVARGKLGEAKTLEEFLENEQKENTIIIIQPAIIHSD